MHGEREEGHEAEEDERDLTQHDGNLSTDPSATLDELREAVAMLEETAPVVRRMFGAEHPITKGIERELKTSRARAALSALRAREAPPTSG